MNLEEIKKALSEGKKVFWSNENYEVISSLSQYWIHSISNGNWQGLTNKKGELVEDQKEFFTNI